MLTQRSLMKIMIIRSAIVAVVGVIFFTVYSVVNEFTTVIPEQHEETAYFVFMTPWMLWGFFFLAITVVQLLFGKEK